jgi:RNA polymerase sigma factor (sigma-70 family)
LTNVVSIDAGGHRAAVLARRDALVASAMPLGRMSLVYRIARKVARTLPVSFCLADLIGVGNVALLHAATRYRATGHGGTPFLRYAWRVVHGAIVESVRRNRYIENTRQGIEAMDHRFHPSYQAWALDEDINEIGALIRMATLPTWEEAVDRRRQARRVSEAISWLSADERRVLELFHSADEPTLEEIADRMGLVRREVQALRRSAMAALKRRLLPDLAA